MPELVTDFVLEDVSEISGLAREKLKIIHYQKHTWPDGCMGLKTMQACTRGVVSGWIVTVESETQKWIDRAASGYGAYLVSHSQRE